MSTRHIPLSLPGDAPARLTLQEPLSPQAFVRLENQVAQALRDLRAELAPGVDVAGEREFDSWLRLLREARLPRDVHAALACGHATSR
ncbi:MAG: hypothetical protein H6934_03720 [Burkholderiaceae bacterium]|nr:hypothetical protein [Burkholderiaceae bacterium]